MPGAIVTFNVQDIFPYNLLYSGKIRKGIIFKFLSSIQRYGYKHSNHIITISEDMKDLLIEDGTPAEKIDVIYNWSYQDDYYKNVNYKLVGNMFSKAYFNVCYAGNIGLLQNVDSIIKAALLMKEEDDVWFHIVGDGIYKKKLEEKAKEWGVTNITFWPRQLPDMAPAIYGAADVNIIPLARNIYRTALPSKTATCVACGKPIIFAIGKNSKFGKKIEKEVDCIVVDSEDTDELVNAIVSIKNRNDCKKHESKFFKENMGASNNSARYAKIIVGNDYIND